MRSASLNINMNANRFFCCCSQLLKPLVKYFSDYRVNCPNVDTQNGEIMSFEAV